MSAEKTLTDWRAVLADRIRQEVEFASDYKSRFDHGTVGHIGYTALNTLTRLLDNQQAMLDDKFGPGQQPGRKVLPVPYRSQWQKGAGLASKDCGPACIGMMLDYAAGGQSDVTIDDIMRHVTGGVNRPTGFSELQKAALALGGVTLLRKNNWTWEGMKELLDVGLPSMALIKNGYFLLRLDRNNTTGHFFVVVGHDVIYYQGQAVERVIVNDPNWWQEHTAQGALLPIIKDDFMKMWTGAQEDWGNPARAALVMAEAP